MALRKSTNLEKDVFKYLNYLRDSGVTNMFGATPYISAEFPSIDGNESRKYLTLWMNNFSMEGDYDMIEE